MEEMTKEEMQRYLIKETQRGSTELEAYRNLMEILGVDFPNKKEEKMLKGNDMIVNLYRLPQVEKIENMTQIKRAFVGDKEAILSFVKQNFSNSWVYEVEHALMQDIPKCFIAVEHKKIVGFACFDSSAKGFFGPIGVSLDCRGKKVGQALLIRTLYEMKEYGYGYAIIGWVNDAEWFYRKTVGAEWIKGGNPENSVYSNMISVS